MRSPFRGLCRRGFRHRSLLVWFVFLASGCETEGSKVDTMIDAGHPKPPPATLVLPAEAPRAPDIILDATSVSVGNERVPAAEQGLADKVAVLVSNAPAIAGGCVDFVAMRNAKPSVVAAMVSALRRAKANGVTVKTEMRDGTTQQLSLSFPTTVADCTTVAWIAKDAAIDVWPAGGGTAKRIIKGMAGPDMTLGTEAVQRQSAACGVSDLVVGAEDRFPWGLIFDLAMASLQTPGTRVHAAMLVTNAVPGRKLAFEAR